jgi:lipase maturation factor 1
MFESIDTQPSPLALWLGPKAGMLRARWLFLRALGLIFFSAFYALWSQIHGLIGERGILPAGAWLRAAHDALGARAYWIAPSLLWINSSDNMMTAIVSLGVIASVTLTLNLWPRMSIAVATVCFLSFVAAAQDFSAYQSDGMLLEAGFLSLFFAPPGLRPGLGAAHPPSRASWFLLVYEWFRIYFESGLVKILSGEEQWRNLTAMDHYYENGPLPTWLGWYVQHWPHGFHAFTAGATLAIELLLVWLIVFGRIGRWIAFAITTPLQIGIILTANYAFLNYLVLVLGILLVERRACSPVEEGQARTPVAPLRLAAATVLAIHFATTTAMFFFPRFPTAVLLDPFRIANSFGLFAVMTRARYEIEFQGTADGKTWIAYPFAYKPQDPRKAPGIFAPYQPRFDWNLWFASLGAWQDNPWVLNVEQRLLENSPPVLRLFAGNPFAKKPPAAVRAVMWQYWFSSREEHARTGVWWDRKRIGEYAPALP